MILSGSIGLLWRLSSDIGVNSLRSSGGVLWSMSLAFRPKALGFKMMMGRGMEIFRAIPRVQKKKA
jgi:hypothetical protein